MTDQTAIKVVFLQGKKTVLRPLGKSTDLDLCLKWFNDPEVIQFVRRTLPMYEMQEEEWFNNLHKRNNNITLGIATKSESRLIGTMGLHDIEWVDRTATTGACIGEKELWGKGYGSDAKMALLHYAFLRLNLRKIYSRVFAFNERSIRYSLKCGYEIEARLKDHVYYDGEYHDLVILSVTVDKFLPKWKEWNKQE